MSLLPLLRSVYLRYYSFSLSTIDTDKSPFDIAHLIDQLLQGLRTFRTADNVLALIILLLADASMSALPPALTPRDDGLHSQFIRAFCTSSALQDAIVAAIGEMPTLLTSNKQQSCIADDSCAHVLRVARRIISTVFDEGTSLFRSGQ